MSVYVRVAGSWELAQYLDLTISQGEREREREDTKTITTISFSLTKVAAQVKGEGHVHNLAHSEAYPLPHMSVDACKLVCAVFY